jgi:class 3 adenylate cyclase/tetratricopeptide (TPR) repeat protein
MLPSGQVTFLFTDIEGSTRLFQKDHAAMDAALVKHHDILHRAVRDNGGHVFQIIGDAFCAAFAKPNDAIRAALSAQHELHRSSWPGIGDMRVRMGIHTGHAELRGETYPSSLTLVHVQRVMSAGHGEQTLVAASTAELVLDNLPDGVTLKDLGDHRLRGLSEAVRLHQLVSPEMPAEFPPLKTVEIDLSNPASMLDLLHSGIMVGRATELEELRHHLSLATQSRGHLVLVSGEPGVGKTRLAQTLMEEARAAGAIVLRGGCYEYEATAPYLPFVEAIRDWVHWHSGERLRDALESTAAELVKLAPEIEFKLGPVNPNTPLPAAEERLRLFDNVARFLDNLARSQGLVVFLDDLHWADESTLSLLHYLLRHLRASRVLFVGAYREVELDRRHPLSRALVDWGQNDLTTRIALSRLTRDDTAELVGSLFGQEHVSDEFIDLLYSETEGNPFFVEETVKALIEQGSIYREGDSWQRDDVERLVVPQSVRDAVGRRLNRIDERTISLLHTAAALGKQFEFRDLAAVMGGSEDELLDSLDEASTAQLIAVANGDAYKFSHDMIREVLYEEISPIRRRRLHQKVGECFVELYSESEERYDDIAHHFTQSGDLEGSLRYSRLAASVSTSVNAFQEARQHLERARESAEALGDDLLASEIVEESGDLAFLEGRTPDAAGLYEQALEGATGIWRGQLEGKVGRAYCLTGDERGIAFIERALEVLAPETHPVERSLALSALGRYYHYQARLEDAIAELDQARQLAEETDNTLALETAYAFLSGAFQHLRKHETANEWARKLVQLGEARDYPHSVALGCEFLAENNFMVGRFREAVEFATRDREIGIETGALDRVAWGGFGLSQALYGMGRLHDAWAAASEAYEVCTRIGEERLLSWMDSALSLIASDIGDDTVARDYAVTGLERTRKLGQPVLLAWALNAAGYRLMRKGRFDEALPHFNKCHELLDGTELKVSRTFFVANMAEALAGAGHTDRARELIQEEHRAARETDGEYSLIQIRRVEARMTAQGGDLSSAIAAMREVIAEEEERGLLLACGRDMLALADMLDESGDAEQARSLRSRGEALLAECGVGSGIPE